MDTKGEGKMANVSYDRSVTRRVFIPTSVMGARMNKRLTHAPSFISSKPFEFVVGPNKRVFTIHSALVASLSPVLERLVNGDMLEAKTGSVVWEHVDEQTFVRFSQYAYMKTYEYPLSTVR